eukprot:GILK01008944.1.p1 GENE.GILK01008944.1~~GILK01008944.1.p1  ORF type:complete len:244 (-),score=23.16 GILK01008944.1:132-824(-)
METCEGVLVSQGAEGRIFLVNFLSRPTIVKERFEKKYRHPALDAKLTKQRITTEVRCMARCRKAGIETPCVYFVDPRFNRIYMEYLADCITVKQFLYNHSQEGGPVEPTSDAVLSQLAHKLGLTISKMHDNDIVHGDLTTSNFMVRPSPTESLGSLVMIDFGLSYTSPVTEDKAVDLYVLERAFISTHPKSEHLFKEVLQAYSRGSRKAYAVLDKLSAVRQRGRKKSMIG